MTYLMNTLQAHLCPNEMLSISPEQKCTCSVLSGRVYLGSTPSNSTEATFSFSIIQTSSLYPSSIKKPAGTTITAVSTTAPTRNPGKQGKAAFNKSLLCNIASKAQLLEVAGDERLQPKGDSQQTLYHLASVSMQLGVVLGELYFNSIKSRQAKSCRLQKRATEMQHHCNH